MDTMEDYLWLLAVAGGAVLLGAALAYGVLQQRLLLASEQDRQDARVRSLYSNGSDAGGGRCHDGPHWPGLRTGPLLLAVIFIVVGCAFGHYVASQSTARFLRSRVKKSGTRNRPGRSTKERCQANSSWCSVNDAAVGFGRAIPERISGGA